MKIFHDATDTHHMPTALYRGINLGNALDAPNEGEWDWVIEEQHFDVIKQAGFDHVRIPIRWSAHNDDIAYFFKICDKA